MAPLPVNFLRLPSAFEGPAWVYTCTEAIGQTRSPMLFDAPLPFVKAFVDQIDEAIEQHQPQARLSTAQRAWLSFCIMAVLICNVVCWAQFERASLGAYSVSALSWMFRHSKIPWDLLLPMSTRVILRRHGLCAGVLVLDDSDKRRSKTTKRIAHVHKVKDKATGGYFRGQTLVFLVLVTDKLTLPVGFAFYQPDPVLSAWHKQQKRLKKQGVPPQAAPGQAAEERCLSDEVGTGLGPAGALQARSSWLQRQGGAG